MPINGQWKFFSAFGGYPADVPGHSSGRIKALPSQQLRTPRQIGVLTIGEEMLVEKLSLDRDILDHFVAIQRGSAGRSEDIFRCFKLSLIQFFSAPIEMTKVG